MKNVNYIIGSENICTKPLSLFSDDACSFLNDLSVKLMRSRQFPDVLSFAFWCRKANIASIKQTYPDTSCRLGRGLVFHVAPSNVPVNFAFSYAFSLLAGNANIVRIPSKPFQQIPIICNAIKEIIKGYPEIEKRTAMISYPADNEITEEFSKMSDARVIWGGDTTINNIKTLSSKPRCIDIVFPDRYSFAIINGAEIISSDETRLSRLAEQFYNDTYLMDQNACSSPQLILWINDSEEARSKFWNHILSVAKNKYDLQPAVSVDKYMIMCENAIDCNAVKSIKHDGNILYRAEISYLPEHIESLRGKCGYFYEYSLNSLDEIIDTVTEKFQTLTFFGFEAEELSGFVISNKLSGIDRIVPMGSAMDIGVIWDGYDIISTLSRIISTK